MDNSAAHFSSGSLVRRLLSGFAFTCLILSLLAGEARASIVEEAFGLIENGNKAVRSERQANCTQCDATASAAEPVARRKKRKSVPVVEEALDISPNGAQYGSLIVGQCRMGRRGFGVHRHPILKKSRMHWGQDIAAPRGTPVRAPLDGVVTSQKKKGGYGKMVVMKLKNGLTIELAHLSRYGKSGPIKKGEIIGYVGATGLSTGPHLHLNVKNQTGRLINPKSIFKPIEMCRKR